MQAWIIVELFFSFMDIKRGKINRGSLVLLEFKFSEVARRNMDRKRNQILALALVALRMFVLIQEE